MRRAAASLAAVSLLMLAAPANSASDGSMGATSNGSSSVSVTIPSLVRITGIADLTIASYSSPSSFAADDVCVYSNTAVGYDITATSSEGSFVLTNTGPPATQIGYAVEWNASSGQTSGTALTYNTALTGQSTGGANPTCGNVGGANASLIVRVTDSDLGTAPAQTYTGTLLLLIEPN